MSIEQAKAFRRERWAKIVRWLREEGFNEDYYDPKNNPSPSYDDDSDDQVLFWCSGNAEIAMTMHEKLTEDGYEVAIDEFRGIHSVRKV